MPDIKRIMGRGRLPDTGSQSSKGTEVCDTVHSENYTWLATVWGHVLCVLRVRLGVGEEMYNEIRPQRPKVHRSQC